MVAFQMFKDVLKTFSNPVYCLLPYIILLDTTEGAWLMYIFNELVYSTYTRDYFGHTGW